MGREVPHERLPKCCTITLGMNLLRGKYMKRDLRHTMEALSVVTRFDEVRQIIYLRPTPE